MPFSSFLKIKLHTSGIEVWHPNSYSSERICLSKMLVYDRT